MLEQCFPGFFSVLWFCWSEDQGVEDFAAVIKILCREVKQKCTERVTGWGDGQSSHIIEQSKCWKLLELRWILSQHGMHESALRGQIVKSTANSYLTRDTLLDEKLFRIVPKPPISYHSYGRFLKEWITFFSYSGSLSDKRFMFTSNGKKNGLIFTFFI